MMPIKEDIIKSFGDNIVLTGNSIVDKKIYIIDFGLIRFGQDTIETR